MKARMDFDDVAWGQSDDISDQWSSQFVKIDALIEIGLLLLTNDPRPDDSGPFVDFDLLARGGYNITFLMEYSDAGTVIRLSQPGLSLFPEEKTKNEVAMMRYIADQTDIPVPSVIYSGKKDDSKYRLGPFIVMNYLPHACSMYALLKKPDCRRGTLDPDINEDQLHQLYKQIAKVLLQLFQLKLPKIGSIDRVDSEWDVVSRPLSMNMNELVRLGTMPRSKLPPIDTTFETSSSYYEALAELEVHHLSYQRNDAITSADDCRRKFVARQLFYKLEKEKKLSLDIGENGPFRIWCDDLRPSNILVDEEMEICGVVDWEFTYAAPMDFAGAPPWWLLIKRPECWSEGLDNWTEQFDRRLKTFLAAMRTWEDADSQYQGTRLSDLMQRSWESGDFWVMYAISNSFAFDSIYWQKIDQRFFGKTITDDPSEAWKERLCLLDEAQLAEMDELVTRKVEEMDDKVLAWDPGEATEEFRQLLKLRRERKAKKEKERKEKEEGEENEENQEGGQVKEQASTGESDEESNENSDEEQEQEEHKTELPDKTQAENQAEDQDKDYDVMGKQVSEEETTELQDEEQVEEDDKVGENVCAKLSILAI